MTLSTSLRNVWAAPLAALIVVSAAQAAPRPVSIGVNANYEHNLARAANIGWVRIDVVWYAINPAPGAWDFSGLDGQVQSAIDNGQQILGILSHPPTWVGGGPNHNGPPLSTAEWSEFVGRVAQKYRGKIAAYEIWNEPDQKSGNKEGIGWTRNIEESPLYVDFVHVAAQQIRAQAPGTLVVAPVFQSRNDSDGADNRKRRIFQQIQAATYADGPGSNFIDVASFHANAASDEGPGTMASVLRSQNLAYLQNYAPSLRNRPIWVTEFGWRSNAVGETTQRQRICEFLRLQTGSWNASQTGLDQWDIRRSFIYLLKDPGSSAAIYRGDGTPTPTVTEYLQRLTYPATQNTVVNGDYDPPSCFGTTAGGDPPGGGGGGGPLPTFAPKSSAAANVDALVSKASMQGYRVVDATANDGASSIALEDDRGGHIAVSMRAAQEGDEVGNLSDSGIRWRRGDTVTTIAASNSAAAAGRNRLLALAKSFDVAVADACLSESLDADAIDDSALAARGVRAPSAPRGYVAVRTSAELSRRIGRCSGSDEGTVDAVWELRNRNGSTLQAGVYRYGEADGNAFIADARSIHWSDANGFRYWVSALSGATPSRTTLEQIARSLDPTFAH